jgi:hypothetical protein
MDPVLAALDRRAEVDGDGERSPSRSGCSRTARNAVAADAPPNGPMKVQ